MLWKNKIDLNLIIDINPEKFKRNIGNFIDQVKSTDYLNLFINGLSNQSSRDLEFLKPLSIEERIKNEIFSSNVYEEKINQVCDLFWEELRKWNTSSNN